MLKININISLLLLTAYNCETQKFQYLFLFEHVGAHVHVMWNNFFLKDTRAYAVGYIYCIYQRRELNINMQLICQSMRN